MRRLRPIFGVAGAVALATICATPAIASATTVKREGLTLEFYGPIDAESVGRAQRLMGGARVLEINSPGGENASPIRFATAVADNGLDVVVNGNCYSACAHYVFMAGRRKIVSIGSLLMFHGSPFAWSRLLEKHPSALTDGEKRLARADAAAASRLYGRLGINLDLFLCSDRAMGVGAPKPEQLIAQTAENGRPGIQGTATFALIHPSVLTHFGVRDIAYFWFPEPAAEQRIGKLRRLNGAPLAWVRKPSDCGP